MSAMPDLLKRVYKLRLAPVSPDTDLAARLLCRELPFKVHEFPSLSEHNGWVVPYSWRPLVARIMKGRSLVYDGMKHPLGVMGYAKPFKGRVSLEELKKHLTFRKDQPQAIGYHCDYFYKPWLADWGFSVPYALYKKLKPGKYDIDLRIELKKGTLKVLDYFLPGKSRDTIFFNAHNCHAAQANDDISGVVVGIELMKMLSRKKNRYSYRLVIAPEHIGTVFYLKSLKEKAARDFKYGFFLEMLGNDNRLILQRSFLGDTEVDKASMHYLATHYPDSESRDFRKVVGNDETVWESPGYEIPTVSLSRAPYPQYHTSLDNEGIILEGKLREALNALMGIINIFETDCFMDRKFKGLVALSNPKFDLYMKPGTDPSLGDTITKEGAKWNYLMDCLPRYFDGKHSILDIAHKYGLPYEDVYNYIEKFRKKGLVVFSNGKGKKG